MTINKKINMWSGPRNVSTALMYSFAQRKHTCVVDEPFYAHYLWQSGAKHPGRTVVLKSQPKDAEIAMQRVLNVASDRNVLFMKNMAHHMIGMDEVLETLLFEFEHVFLIRDPLDMILSLQQTLPNPTMRDTAYQRQLELFELVKSKGYAPHVVDSRELLKDPEEILSKLCSQFDIPFTCDMLSWKSGPIPEDGVWAKHWYQQVYQSTGFIPYRPKSEALPEQLIPLYEQCKPVYDKLFAHAIKTN